MWIKFPSLLTTIQPPVSKQFFQASQITPEVRKKVRSWVIHKDDDIIVINKPAGLAVQGGTKVRECLANYLPALTYTAGSPPKLVHRLDRDASGIMVLARTTEIARHLSEMWEAKEIKKLYWAVLIGAPIPRNNIIKTALGVKRLPEGPELVVPVQDEKRA